MTSSSNHESGNRESGNRESGNREPGNRDEPQHIVPPHDRADLRAELLEQASLHALGALEDAETRGYELHLDDCRACEAEVDSYDPVIEALGLVANPVEPAGEVLGRVMARARATAAGSLPGEQALPDPDPGLFFATTKSARWEPLRVEGVEVCVLRVHDDERATMLVRMAPGASYPAHRHGTAEECYVLQGDLNMQGHTLREGDYQFAAPDSEHGVQWTNDGCVLFIRGSTRDELIDTPA